MQFLDRFIFSYLFSVQQCDFCTIFAIVAVLRLLKVGLLLLIFHTTESPKILKLLNVFNNTPRLKQSALLYPLGHKFPKVN